MSSKKLIRFSAILSIMSFLAVHLVSCSDGGANEVEAFPQPPSQAELPDGAVDVCHRWNLELYYEIRDEAAGIAQPSEKIDLFYFEELFPMAACTYLDAARIPFHADIHLDLLDENPSHGEWKIVTLYGELLGPEGFAAIWNNTIRKDGKRTDYDNPAYFDDFDWSEGQKESQFALGRILAALTDPEISSLLPEDFFDEWIETGEAVIQTRTYEYDNTFWDHMARKPRVDDTRDYSDWEVHVEGPQVYGWSILAPLLRFGDFDESFLIPMATAIIEFDREHDGNWLIDGQEPISFDAYDDDPVDSMDAVLESLSRNPAAAQAVYDATGDERVAQLLSST